jgi:hypothetical protein
MQAGFAALEAGDNEAADGSFAAALQMSPQNSDALGGLGIVRLRQSRFGEARSLLTDADTMAHDGRWREALRDARFWEAATHAGEMLASGDLTGAIDGYQRALLIDPENSFAKAQIAAAEAMLEAGRETVDQYAAASRAPGPPVAGTRAATSSPFIFAPGFRRREGEPGLGRLREWSGAMVAPLGDADSGWTITLSPVRIESGRLATDTATRDRFGAGPLARNAVAIPAQTEEGVGLALAWRGENWSADIGTTPLGFRMTDISAGLRVQGTAGSFGYTLQASRRPVTESVLAFAGAADARGGREWGGVSATGGRAELSRDFGGWGIYGYGGGALASGHNVADNTRLEAGTGFYMQVSDETDRKITSGLGVSVFGYDRNLGQFTFGHGGYFSPQSFVTVGVPIDWAERAGALSWRVQAYVGMQRFHTAASPFFPDDDALQAAAAALGTAVYASDRVSGMGYNLSAVSEYAVSPQLSVGGYVFADNATDFRQVGGGFYLRLDPESRGPTDFRLLQPLRTPYPMR